MNNDEILNIFEMRLMRFSFESNRIEGILSEIKDRALFHRLKEFISIEELTLQDVCNFNIHGRIRDRIGDNVKVGSYYPPKGGIEIKESLEAIIQNANKKKNQIDIYYDHIAFEKLHPFMDGNGRTGRAIWLWQMITHCGYTLKNAFLHEWYYQSIQANEENK